MEVADGAQGMGVGRFAIQSFADEARARGFARATVVWGSGAGGPEEFFKAVGFSEGNVDEFVDALRVHASDNKIAEVIEHEKKIARANLLEQGKPEAMLDKILPGKLEKWFKENCLLEQPFFKDAEGKRTVQDEINSVIAVIGENMSVRRFTRYVLGEGLVKEQKDFAAEVSAAVGGAKK